MVPDLSFISSLQVKALLYEIRAALEDLQETNQTKMIFLSKMALSPKERTELLDKLGLGSIQIEMKDSSEAVKWEETKISGVWLGRYVDPEGEITLETIEICKFPELAAVQSEDLLKSLKSFTVG